MRRHLCIIALLSAGLSDSEALSLSQQSPQSTTSSSKNRILKRTAFPNSKQTTPEDLECMQRQTGQTAPVNAAIGIPSTCNCRHGFPQAFAMDPFPATGRINSGLVKLTCPHLVTAIDALEDDGFIQKLSSTLAVSEEWQSAAIQVHEKHARTRYDLLINDDDEEKDAQLDTLRSKLGDRAAKALMDSGVAGSTTNSLDVKCLHAWMGDHLFFRDETVTDTDTETGVVRVVDVDEEDSARSMSSEMEVKHDSPIGQAVCDALKDRGIDVRGTDSCHLACNPQSTVLASPPNPRNKQRLRSRKEVARRKRRKQENSEV